MPQSKYTAEELQALALEAHKTIRQQYAPGTRFHFGHWLVGVGVGSTQLLVPYCHQPKPAEPTALEAWKDDVYVIAL